MGLLMDNIVMIVFGTLFLLSSVSGTLYVPSAVQTMQYTIPQTGSLVEESMTNGVRVRISAGCRHQSNIIPAPVSAQQYAVKWSQTWNSSQQYGQVWEEEVSSGVSVRISTECNRNPTRTCGCRPKPQHGIPEDLCEGYGTNGTVCDPEVDDSVLCLLRSAACLHRSRQSLSPETNPSSNDIISHDDSGEQAALPVFNAADLLDLFTAHFNFCEPNACIMNAGNWFSLADGAVVGDPISLEYDVQHENKLVIRFKVDQRVKGGDEYGERGDILHIVVDTPPVGRQCVCPGFSELHVRHLVAFSRAPGDDGYLELNASDYVALSEN